MTTSAEWSRGVRMFMDGSMSSITTSASPMSEASWSLPEEEWDRIFAVNLKGCYLTMKHVIPIMEKQGGGSIINISSVAGIRYTGVPYSTYYATKAAMIHLTRTTAVQYAPKHIRVNAVLPGLMKTPMVEKTAGLAAQYGKGDIEEMWKVRDAQCPMGHMGDAWDVAASARRERGPDEPEDPPIRNPPRHCSKQPV